jgi:hypothetical protein
MASQIVARTFTPVMPPLDDEIRSFSPLSR